MHIRVHIFAETREYMHRGEEDANIGLELAHRHVRHGRRLLRKANRLGPASRRLGVRLHADNLFPQTPHTDTESLGAPSR